MPDETVSPGQPGQGASPEAPGNDGQGFDFERSYNEIRPAYTKATQDLAATTERLSAFEDLFEQLHDEDPEVQQAAMDALGFELDTGQPTGPAAGDPEEWVDPLEQEVAELRAWRDEQQQRLELEASQAAEAEVLALRDEYVGQAISQIEEAQQQKFSETDEEVLGNLAIAMAGPDQIPDVEGAYERLYGESGFLESHREGWIDTKRAAAQAPFGTTIPADRKPQTDRERASYFDQRVAAMENQA